MMNKEVWKTVEGWSRYEFSDQGRVKSLEFVDRRGRLWPEIIMKQTINRMGYNMATLWCDRTRKHRTVQIHRLILLAHGLRLPGRDLVNHIDHNKTNNRLENLEWVTQGENMARAKAVGVLASRKSKPLGSRFFSLEQIREIRQERATTGLSFRKLGIKYKVDESTIRAIVAGKHLAERDWVVKPKPQNYKLTREQVLEIRKIPWEDKQGRHQAAVDYGVTQATINSIIKRINHRSTY